MDRSLTMDTVSDPEDFPPDDFFRTAHTNALVEVAADWFHWNFEDPAHSTPYETAEGGYQYIWGGPYDASEELFARFSQIISEEAILAAVEAVEEDGIYDWAPSSRRIIEEDFDYDPPSSAALPEELRSEAIAALDSLESALQAVSGPAGIGHNQPPEPIDSEAPPIPDEQRIELVEVLVATRVALSEGNPRLSFLQKSRAQIAAVAAAVGKWLAKKADRAVDTAIDAGIPVAIKWGAIYLASVHFDHILAKVIEAIN